MESRQTEPLLIRRKSGRTFGAVIAFGIGGGLFVLGVLSAIAGSVQVGAIWPAISGYLLALLPLFAVAAVLAACRRELWLLPEQRVLRMLTFRPWLIRGPRVEQASLDDYVAVRTIHAAAGAQGDGESPSLCVVALVARDGGDVPLRQLADTAEAEALAAQVAELSGLPLDLD
jgi:hypothetical protein